MPIINGRLDSDGHAVVEIVLHVPLLRRQALQQAGLPVPPPQIIRGLLDSGATVSCIDPQVRQALGLPYHRFVRVAQPNNPAPVRVPTFRVDLGILVSPATIAFRHPMLSVLEMPTIMMNVDALIGCDVLSTCVLNYNGLGGTFTLAF